MNTIGARPTWETSPFPVRRQSTLSGRVAEVQYKDEYNEPNRVRTVRMF